MTTKTTHDIFTSALAALLVILIGWAGSTIMKTESSVERQAMHLSDHLQDTKELHTRVLNALGTLNERQICMIKTTHENGGDIKCL